MNQNIEYEIIQDNDYNLFNIDEMECAFFPRPLHYHPEYEITFIEKGEGFCFAGDGITLMRPMHIYFFGSNLPHFFKSDNSYYLPTNKKLCHSIFTQFKEEILPVGYKYMPECKNIRKLLNKGVEGLEWDVNYHPKIHQLVQNILHQKSFKRLLVLYELLNELGKNIDDGKNISSKNYINMNETEDPMYCKIISYVSLHFQEDITLEQIAAFAGMNTSSICRYFKKKTGGTIFDLILKLRIAYTKRQLSNTDNPISSIAYDAGFNNLANFNIQFKKMTGYTPSQYRILFI